MRIASFAAALLLLVAPLSARAALPPSACPDVLIGDSLAVGMGPYARAAGFEVVARTGIGLNWLREQSPRCARRVVVVIGTNDLRGIDPWSAEAYPQRLAAIMRRWPAQQVIWATPGCFPYDERLERGSEALARAAAQGAGALRVHAGRPARCSYLSGDGIHPSGTGYRAWWASLSRDMGPVRGPVMGGADNRAARSQARRQSSSPPPARLTRHNRAVPSARTLRPARSLQAPRQARSARSVQARAGTAHLSLQARTAPPARSARQAGPPRSRQQAQPERVARPAPRQAAPGRQTRPPVPSRPSGGAPIRRT